jgi:hypothetical protein
LLIDSPETILFTDKNGNTASLEEVIDDGLDGGYEHRIPALGELLQSGSPYHQLLACIVLTSWGELSGFEAIIKWASNTATVPWAKEVVSVDRIYGADDSFERLADAVKTSYWNDENLELRKRQREAASSLLKLHADYYFGRTLSLALLKDPVWQTARQDEVAGPIEISLQAIQRGKQLGFDLAFQTASLLLVLARANDELTADFAERLLAQCQTNKRMLRELVSALGDASGRATLRTLYKLKRVGDPVVEAEADQALSRRESKM